MDGWGALTMLIKRQESAKIRKSHLKYELQKRKESFLKTSSSKAFNFPEISKEDMEKLKAEIRKQYKQERLKGLLVNFIILISIIFAFSFIIFYISR